MNRKQKTSKSEKNVSSKSSSRRERKKKSKKAEDDKVIDTTEKGNESDSDNSIAGLIEFPDGTEEWIIEKVIGKKVVRGTVHYRVKWQGWKSMYNTWEPKDHLKNSKDAVREFEKTLAAKLKERKNTRVTLPSKVKEEIKLQEDEQVIVKREVIDNDGVASGDLIDGGEEQLKENGGSSKTTVKDLTQKFGRHVTIGKESGTEDSEEEVVDTDAEEVIVIESEEDEEEVDPDFIGYEMGKWGPSYPMVRHSWKREETPLFILGSTYNSDALYHMIRVKTLGDTEDVLEDPYKGLSKNNVIVIASNVFRYEYPQMLIDYYHNALFPLKNTKNEDEMAKDAARNSMVNYFQRIGYKTNYKRMLEDNMPPDQRVSEKQLRKYDNCHVPNKKKTQEEDEQCIYPTDENGEIMYNKAKDDFGLPLFYGDEVEDDKDEYVTDSDSDEEEQRWRKLEIRPLKVPRIKNRPNYEKVMSRPFPNLPGIDRLVYRRVKE